MVPPSCLYVLFISRSPMSLAVRPHTGDTGVVGPVHTTCYTVDEVPGARSSRLHTYSAGTGFWHV